ncbi:hypothetical protein BVZ77_01618A, partial [Haemophilus influenzae]
MNNLKGIVHQKN